MSTAASEGADCSPPPGAVELREDVPLKVRAGGAGARWCAGGPRLIAGAFAALSAAVTLALLTQIYSGDYQLVPHGSVSSSAAACSRAGTDALKAGGRALDAAVAAALCLAVLLPHRTSLDASGALLYWRYRSAHAQPPALYEWGAARAPGDAPAPRLLAALAALHARHGTLPWPQLLTPAIELASGGFPVSEGLSQAARAAGVAVPPAGAPSAAPALARYMRTLLLNTSAELSGAWGAGGDGDSLVRESSPLEGRAGAWRVLAGGAGAAAALRALAAAFDTSAASPEDAQRRAVAALQREAAGGGWPPGGVASGLAVVDRDDTYVALVTGLSAPFGSGPPEGAWVRDEPAAPLDLAPAFLLDGTVCGARYVVGAESSAALAQGGAALMLGAADAPLAVERARVRVLAGGALALEAARAPPLAAALPAPPLANATPPYASLNFVLQRGDALLSHADSRGGGLASRF